MYRYFNNNPPEFIISDINYLTDYIYEKSYNIIKNKFNGDILDELYEDSIYLNPYLRTILILKTANAYINLKLKIYDIKQFNKYKIHKYKILKNDAIVEECKKYLKFLLRFNGEVKFKTVLYKNVEIDYEMYNYEFIKNVAYKFLNKSEIEEIEEFNKIPNNMFDEHYQFKTFIKSCYYLFYNLGIYQMYIHEIEIKNIKKYIKKLIIKSLLKKDNDENIKINYMIDYKSMKYFKSCIGENENCATFIKNDDKITLMVNDEIKNVFKDIDEKEIEEIKNINITDLLEDIKNEYVDVLNINPFALNFSGQKIYVEPFDILYLYEMYKNIYETL